MSLDPQRVIEAVKTGMCVVCSTCQHWWEAQDAGKFNCGQDGCAGPIAGKDFPKYKGELPDLQRWCFACGSSSDYSLTVPEGTRPLGVCKNHVRLLQDLVPETAVDGKLILQVGGGLLTLEEVRRPTEPTLFQSLILDEIAVSNDPSPPLPR